MTSPTENSKQHSWLDYALFMAALAFCAFSAKAFFKEPERGSPSPSAEKIMRKPASLENFGSVPEHSTRILELNCTPKQSQLTTGASLLQVVGSDCAGLAITAARNETTGEDLLLFKQPDKVSTHYFPLKAGKNKIVIQWRGKKGKKEEEINETLEVERSS